MKLADWLIQQIEQDILWATEASRRDDGITVETGVHWQWETDDDRPVEPDPGATEFVGGPDGFSVSLRSRETWPTRSVGPLPQFALYSTEQVPSAVGGHIIRHDPARVIHDLRGRLKSVQRCVEAGESANSAEGTFAGLILRDMAETYAERPGYLNEWKSESEK